MELRIYKNSTDHVIAASPEQAMAIHAERSLPKPWTDFVLVPGDARIAIDVGTSDHPMVIVKTAEEWVAEKGAGTLCSLVSY